MDYKSSIPHYFGITLCYSIPAIILGVICEKFTHYFQNKYMIDPLIAIFMQLFAAITFLCIIELYVCPSYGTSWQGITPGLFFVSIFFGLQSSFYNNIHNITPIL